jgi:purine-nucleoside/S-methyl-5'-thioadenosine phosphorylase / adenosine deaminase
MRGPLGRPSAVPYNAFMLWTEDVRDGVTVIRPSHVPAGLVVAFSGRGHAPDREETPTAWLSRRFSRALGLDGMPIHWAHQVHGIDAVTVKEAGAGEPNVGRCDALATALPGAALVVQTADCVPILLASRDAVGAAHAGWRGSARNVAREAVRALEALGAKASTLRAWFGPAVGVCCYEVSGEVAAQFAGDFVRTGCGGGPRLDLKSVNAAQLEDAGVPRDAIAVHPACTKCGGEKFASYRRDGQRSGRMIALIARAQATTVSPLE